MDDATAATADACDESPQPDATADAAGAAAAGETGGEDANADADAADDDEMAATVDDRAGQLTGVRRRR